MTLQTVKLSQLRLSPLNVRRVKPKAIDQLAADMLAHGQLQNLVVYAEGNRFEVAAGGRRYRAFKQLEKAKAISCPMPIIPTLTSPNPSAGVRRAEQSRLSMK